MPFVWLKAVRPCEKQDTTHNIPPACQAQPVYSRPLFVAYMGAFMDLQARDQLVFRTANADAFRLERLWD